MVSAQYVEDQLKKIHYNRGWNRPETDELENILLPDEEIFECVNGWYEGGYALLCATNIRVLLIDKKPFKFLTVEDVRFDTINQIDYSHRMMNANICITAGLKNLTFRSYNQPRLRKLIGHVQHRMAEIKQVDLAEKAKNQGNLQEMNQQLRAYLLGQYEQHQSLKMQHQSNLQPTTLNENDIEPIMAELKPQVAPVPASTAAVDTSRLVNGVSTSELYEDGIKEIFGRYQSEASTNPVKTAVSLNDESPLKMSLASSNDQSSNGLDMNPLKIAYSKLPMILKNKRAQSPVWSRQFKVT